MLRKIKTFKAHDIYYKSPVFIQHIMTSAYGYKLKRERYRKIYKNALKRYVKGDFDKEQKLIHFMKHLKSNIEFYKDIEVDEDNILKSFLKLPFTVKDDLRNGLEERSWKEGIIRISRTSGTTGANLIVYDSEYDREERMAYLDYIKYINGVIPFSKRASFTGQELTPVNHKDKMWRYNQPMRQMLYSTRCMRPDNVRKIYESLKRFKPVSLDGMPYSMHMVAQYILKNDIEIDWDVKAIFPTAETLLPYIKRDLEKAFNTVVIDQYSSAEGAPFIFGSRSGAYKIGEETGLVEFHKVSDRMYEGVMTSFINYATPIVRYKIGDLFEIDSDKEYFNSFKEDINIIKIIGKETDYLYHTDGHKVMLNIVLFLMDEQEETIVQAQFIQKTMNEFVVNIVKDIGYTDMDEHLIREKMYRMLGENIQITFNYTDNISKTKSGKVRYIINEVGGAVA